MWVSMLVFMAGLVCGAVGLVALVVYVVKRDTVLLQRARPAEVMPLVERELTLCK